MATHILSDSDLMYLMTRLRSSDQPLSTQQLVEALKERSKS